MSAEPSPSARGYVWFNGALDQSGGGERLSLEVVRCLREQGHKADYVVYRYDSAATFGGGYDFLAPIARGGEDAMAPGPAARLRRIRWLRAQLLELAPHTVVTSGTWHQVIDVYLATRGTGIRYATHVFGSMFAFGPAKEKLKFGRIFRRNFDRVRESVASYMDVVPKRLKLSPRAQLTLDLKAYVKYRAVRGSGVLFVLSERNRWENQLLYGQNSVVLQGAFPERIFAHRPARDLKADFGLEGRRAILSVGRLAVNKRVDLAIQAFARVAAERPDIDFVIGGTGPEGEKLRALVAELGLEKRVHFVGYIPEDKLWDYLATCDAFLHLDLADFDIAPLEALAMGANVVWSDEMDLPQLRGQLACLWEVPADAAPIAAAVLEAVDAGKDRVTPEARRAVLQPFSWEAYTAAMTQAIDG